MAACKRSGEKYVYFFGEGKAEGDASMKDLLGGKGANLAEMTNLGVPVPPGFTISTEACVYYDKHGKWPAGLSSEIKKNLARLEKVMGREFGDARRPLLVSVRSGARVSMPGMMDTVLNLGLNDESVEGLARETGNDRFAWDSYRRFIQMYGNVVMGIPHEEFEKILDKHKERKGVEQDTELDASDLKKLVADYKKLVKKVKRCDFPQDPKAQLEGAINAVFSSWNNERAIAYRKINNIPDDWGTAVNVQCMVFGNMGEDSATGVAFTRDPNTGEKRYFGEYLPNAQGEDVVAGIRTPHPISIEQKKLMKRNQPSLEEEMPGVYKELVKIFKKLERHYKDMQDIEFTIQQGKLYLLQTRTGKRTGMAAVRIAVDMVKERLINAETAVMRVTPEQLDQLLHPMVDPNAKAVVLAKGLPASPGAAAGRIVFNSEDAVEWASKGESVILVRHETSPEDIEGMHAAQGVLTSTGGMTSHAAVVGRGMGKTCVVGCKDIEIDYAEKTMSVAERSFHEGDWITIDGSTGRVLEGKVPTVDAKTDENYEQLMQWADKFRKLGVWTNADTPADAAKARKFGAEGIGLCRTEHMFFAEDRLPIVKEMVMNITDDAKRRECLEKLLPMQRKDFEGIFKAMEGLPVTVRLLDPPLHEFLEKHHEVVAQLAELKAKGGSKKKIQELEEKLRKIESLEEFNPMLGHRGCRLGITYPEIYKMQVRAIMEAACALKKKKVDVKPEIMIPLVGHANELQITRRMVEEVAEQVQKEMKVKVDYHVGTMIEVPRAALTADQVAEHADFFSFGTNDLTQMTFGFSRDDIGKFLPEYIDKHVLAEDPFVTIDVDGVGKLMRMCVEQGRATNRNLKVGICGEQGGEARSVDFCHRVGLNYVSCSPYRVPLARLAAAQAAIREKREKKAAASSSRCAAKKRTCK